MTGKIISEIKLFLAKCVILLYIKNVLVLIKDILITKYSDLLSYWQCQTCKINLFPLTSLDGEEFFDFFCSTKKLNNTINVSMSSLKENIPALFSVDKFNQDNTTMNLNCEYYDLDEINNLASSTLESLETSLKIFTLIYAHYKVILTNLTHS